MISAVPLQEAAHTFLALVARAREANEDTVLTENGEPVAKIVPIPRPLTIEEHLKRIRDNQKWWMENTSEEERESFARDIEAARTTLNQPFRFDGA